MSDQKFIYGGRRVAANGKSFVMELCTIDEKGNVLQRYYIGHQKKKELIVGGIYKGVKFEENSITGFNSAEFIQKVKNDEIFKLLAEQREADERIEEQKLIDKFKKQNPFLDSNMKELRAAFQKLHMHSTREAFRHLVLEALMTRIDK